MESAFRNAAGVKLIETLGWDGAAFTRLGLHLDRLVQSAARLGWPCDRAEAEAALFHVTRPGEAARIRLMLDAAGTCDVEVAAMPIPKPVWQLGLAPARLVSADPWLGVKSTRRKAYDQARAALPDGLDEVIFLNERGEVCDGTITTLFFDRGAGLCTPPLTCGLLPGVLRAEMLALGRCREELLTGDDLARVTLWVGNSLRGLFSARFTAG